MPAVLKSICAATQDVNPSNNTDDLVGDSGRRRREALFEFYDGLSPRPSTAIPHDMRIGIDLAPSVLLPEDRTNREDRRLRSAASTVQLPRLGTASFGRHTRFHLKTFREADAAVQNF